MYDLYGVRAKTHNFFLYATAEPGNVTPRGPGGLNKRATVVPEAAEGYSETWCSFALTALLAGMDA